MYVFKVNIQSPFSYNVNFRHCKESFALLMAVLEDSAQPQHTCSVLWNRNRKRRSKWGRAVFRGISPLEN